MPDAPNGYTEVDASMTEMTPHQRQAWEAVLPFAGVIAAGARPWPRTGLSTARWIAEVPTMPVAFRELWLGQEHLDIAALFGRPHAAAADDLCPHVVRWRGRLYLEDGHHRVVRWALRGDDCAVMRVYDLEEQADAAA